VGGGLSPTFIAAGMLA